MRLRVYSWKINAMAAAIALPACGPMEDDLLDLGMDGSMSDAAVDSAREAGIDGAAGFSALPDGSARDAGTPDGAVAPCFSPLRRWSLPNRPIAQCSCQVTAESHDGYCIGDLGFYCSEGHWTGGVDGPCVPQLGLSPGWCAANSGFLSDAACPSGFGYRTHAFWDGDGGIEGQCCFPVIVTESECIESGLTVLAPAVDAGILETRCAGGRELRGFITGLPTPSLCCE